MKIRSIGNLTIEFNNKTSSDYIADTTQGPFFLSRYVDDLKFSIDDRDNRWRIESEFEKYLFRVPVEGPTCPVVTWNQSNIEVPRNPCDWNYTLQLRRPKSNLYHISDEESEDYDPDKSNIIASGY